jgi:AbrB family looped-hinge helix DNA binding protein
MLDRAGRLVVPKALRDRAGILPGMRLRIACREGRIEIEPVPREVRVVDRDGFRVAEPLAEEEPLTREAVKRVREEIRAERRRR